MLEFHIPLSREDLLRQGDRSHYVVSECCTATEVASRLEGTTWLAVKQSLKLCLSVHRYNVYSQLILSRLIPRNEATF